MWGKRQYCRAVEHECRSQLAIHRLPIRVLSAFERAPRALRDTSSTQYWAAANDGQCAHDRERPGDAPDQAARSCLRHPVGPPIRQSGGAHRGPRPEYVMHRRCRPTLAMALMCDRGPRRISAPISSPGQVEPRIQRVAGNQSTSVKGSCPPLAFHPLIGT